MSAKFSQIAKQCVCGALVVALSLPLTWAWHGLPQIHAEEPVELIEARPIGTVDNEAVNEETAREIRYWTRQLDADQFAQRQEASEKLLKFGSQAIAPLEETARNGSGEAVSRSVDILRKFASSEEEETAKPAAEALGRLVESGNRAASLAAKNALEETRPMRSRRGADRNGIRGLPGPPGLAGGAARRTVNMSNINGNLTIEVTEDEVTKKLEKSAEGKVTVTVTEGDDPPKVASADSAEALKEQDAEAHAVYEELSKLNGNFRGPGPIRGFGFRDRPPGIPEEAFEAFPNMPAPFEIPDWAEVPRPEFGPGFEPGAQIREQLERMRAERERIFAEMEAMRAERFNRVPRVPNFFREEARPDREEPAEQKQPLTEQQVESLRDRLGRVLERLENEPPTEANLSEIKRLEKILEAIERDLDMR